MAKNKVAPFFQTWCIKFNVIISAIFLLIDIMKLNKLKHFKS